MVDTPASRVRIVSQEPISESEVRIMLEVIVDIHRLAEVGQDFLHTAIDQLAKENKKLA
jgi:hypothetical protein